MSRQIARGADAEVTDSRIHNPARALPEVTASSTRPPVVVRNKGTPVSATAQRIRPSLWLSICTQPYCPELIEVCATASSVPDTLATEARKISTDALAA